MTSTTRTRGRASLAELDELPTGAPFRASAGRREETIYGNAVDALG